MVKEVIKTGNAPAAIGPYSQAIKTANLVFVSGQLPIDPATGEITGGIREQTARALDNISAILFSAGLDMSAVVKTTVFLKDLHEFTAMNEVYQSYFQSGAPARSTVEVAALPRQARVEIEAVAVT